MRDIRCINIGLIFEKAHRQLTLREVTCDWNSLYSTIIQLYNKDLLYLFSTLDFMRHLSLLFIKSVRTWIQLEPFKKMEDNQKSIYSMKSNAFIWKSKTCSNSIEFFHIDMKQNCLFNLYNIKILVFYTYIPCRTTSLVVYIGESILQLPLKSRLHNYTWLNLFVNEINV